jgi:hypothetical protein
MEREEPAVEELAHLDAAAGVGTAARPWRELQPAHAEADGVVPSDRTRVATAEDPVQLTRRPPPDGGDVRGRARKAPVVVGNEGGQELLGRLKAGDTTHPQFTGEAILQGGPEPFDPALGLRRVGRDVGDPQILEHPAEVGGLLGALG